MKSLLLILFLYLIAFTGICQTTNRETFNIKNPGKKAKKICKDTYEVLRSMPQESRFGTEIEGDSVILYFNDPKWFGELIKSKKDGISIDLVQQDQYKCDNTQRLSTSWLHKGYLLPPLYRNEIRKISVVTPDDFIKIRVGVIPKSLLNSNLEQNIIIIENKNLCYYNKIVNVDYHGWGILKMGLFYDTLTSDLLKEKYKELSKTLRFEIPFEKDKSTYNKTDIKPLYDSLLLTDYEIKSITIKAFTSVEGTLDRNMDLQQERATSIVNALQTFQTEKIVSTVLTYENWVEFLEDINGTGYSYLMPLSKDEVKNKLRSKDLLNKLEPILQNHRKGIVELVLEKRVSYLNSNEESLKQYFDNSIADKNIDEALYLQQIIFHKIEKQEIPETFLNKLEVPKALEFGGLLNNQASFLYEQSYSNSFEAIQTFSKLDELLPNNPKIKYNLCAVKLQGWLSSTLHVDENESLKREIESLRKMNIEESLIRRLLINYHIILTETYFKQKKYSQKDQSVKFVFQTYQTLMLNDDDLVNLAKYLSYYSKFDWAEKVLYSRIKSIEVSEDLLFYYLHLTIFYPKNTANKSYRATMLNAININNNRFCKIFDAIKNGGVSFQLLDDSFLKKTYCESCNFTP